MRRPCLEKMAGKKMRIGSVVMALALALISTPVFSHSQVIGSTPDDGATLTALPETVEVEFSENLSEPAFIAVVAPDGEILETNTQIDGNLVRASVGSSDQQGEYAVNFRVVSADGHPITGSVGFTVKAEPTGPSPSPEANSAEVADPDSNSDQTSSWFFIAIAVVVFGWGVTAALWWMQRRDTGNSVN